MSAKLMPLDFAPSSMIWRLMRICMTEAVALTARPARMMMMEGVTKAGAYLKICVMYKRLASEVRPVEKTLPSRRLQSWLTAPERLESSPEEYLRKKFAGRFMMRIMIAASTDSEVLISMRFIMSSRTVEMSWPERMAVSRKTAVPARRFILPLSSTKPVSTRLMGVTTMPKTVTSSVMAMRAA